MAHVVLVHGIGQEQWTGEWLEQRWLPDLADGVRSAGYPQIADLLGRPGGFSTHMVAYGDLFLVADQQGSGDPWGDAGPGEPGADGRDAIGADQAELADRLALEWLSRAASPRSRREEDREVAAEELAYLTGGLGEEQGSRTLMRRAAGSAARIPWFARAGMAAASLVNHALAQVTRYLTDEHLRETVLGRVAAHLDSDTRVLLGHSLGSVVAFEAAHRLQQPLPLLVTLGSPLGLDTIVYHRVRPQPPAYPARVQRWVNLADPEDIVAAQPDLKLRFGTTLPVGCALDCGLVDNAAEPHCVGRYLNRPETGAAVGQILSRATPAHADVSRHTPAGAGA